MRSRNTKIFVLNLRSNKILFQKTDNVFFEKKAGIAKITRAEALEYCRQFFPGQYEELRSYYDKNPSDLIMDFENHFTGLEDSYKDSLEELIINQKIAGIVHKTEISFFIAFQLLRNHTALKQAEEFYKHQNLAKFVVFVDLKHTLSDTNKLGSLILPYVSSRWTLYKSKKMIFPLSDNPVLYRPKHIFLPLSPDLLLEIETDRKVEPAKRCKVKRRISKRLVNEIIQRTIENSSREIVSFDENSLVQIQQSEAFRSQIQLVDSIENSK